MEAGEFNSYFSPLMDKSPSTRNSISSRAKAISDTCSELGLADTWRVLHPDKAFTFHSSVHKSSSRIYFFLTPKISLGNVESCTIGDIVVSDHDPTYISLNNVNPTCQSRPWRYSKFLNHIPNFEKYLK